MAAVLNVNHTSSFAANGMLFLPLARIQRLSVKKCVVNLVNVHTETEH